jgi:predicted acyl esterase
MRRAVALLVAAAAVGLPAHASALEPTRALGHTCSLGNGVVFCPTQNDSERVKTFDGVPLDVDVTLPRSGEAPYPTIVMLHGFPGTKASFESTTPEGNGGETYHWNNNYYARHGYAVLNYSARGFGRSCGEKSSRSSPGCDRGWFHLADQRFELRDAQELLGKLVDEGWADPNHLGATGISYGGGSSLQLAFLRDRIRKTSGSFKPWVSRSGKHLRIAAAYPRWGWYDLGYSLAPNGRFSPHGAQPRNLALDPLGVPKRSLIDALYLGGTAVGYLAPRGADPTADLGTWRDKLFADHPDRKALRAITRQIVNFKSTSGMDDEPANLLIQDGWTDPAFNAIEAIRPYKFIRAHFPKSFVSLQLGDLGHFRAGNNHAMYRDFANDGAAFFARFLKGHNGGPHDGSVKVYGQDCPKGTLGPGPIRVKSYDKLARGSLPQKLRHATIRGEDDGSGKFFDPVANGDPCSARKATRPDGSVVMQRTGGGFTLAGATNVTLDITKGPATFGQIDARLFDVAHGEKRLIDYGIYRLRPHQSGWITFRLAGNVYRFRKGHTARLELAPRFSPWFLPEPGGFKVKLLFAGMGIPVREKANPKLGINPPDYWPGATH